MSAHGHLVRAKADQESLMSRRAGKTLGYARMLRHSLHLRYSVANLLCGVLPDFFSGAVRGRLYRWAGFDIGDGAFIMGNVRVTSATPGLYDKLVVGAGATIADRVTINLDELQPAATIGRLSPRPVLVIHGARDEVVPAGDAAQNFAAAREPKALWRVANATHGATIAPDGATASDRVAEFFTEALHP